MTDRDLAIVERGVVRLIGFLPKPEGVPADQRRFQAILRAVEGAPA